MRLRCRHVALGVFLMAAGSRGFAQAQGKSTAALPVYDVVSIKPNISGSGNMSYDTQENAFVTKNITSRMLMEYAFEIRGDLIEGLDGPADSAHFDIQAKVSDPDSKVMKKLTNDQQREMFMPVLAERFQLRTHRETKVLPIYELVLAKDGSRLKRLTANDTTEKGAEGLGRGEWNWGSTRLAGHAITASVAAHALSQILKRTVIDRTGLEGGYDVALHWTPDTASASDDQTAGSIFTALQEQLGLRLRPSKGPVEVLVVDHVQMPSSN
jgi:uncharacterized protein (TIGR03435 family)